MSKHPSLQGAPTLTSEEIQALSSIDKVLYMMARLRDPNDGCPWDLKQTYDTVVPYTIEETHELAEAIDSGDVHHIKDELGDLLLQVIFYAQIAKDSGEFNFDQVAEGLLGKMLRRHPHVFPDGTLASRASDAVENSNSRQQESDIKSNWDRIKQEESTAKNRNSALDGIPKGLPSIPRAEKLQKKAAKVGFDWPSVDGAFDKLDEEIAELKAEFQAEQKNPEAIAEELGDVMFTCVNIARLMDIDSDTIMRAANRKFETRFRAMEESIKEDGQSFGELSLEEMEAAWQRVKLKGKKFSGY